MVEPIKPSDIGDAKAKFLPPEVIETFNELIALNYVNGVATVKQEDALQLILAKLPNLTRQDVFSKKYLNVEALYESAGWSVYYDKPAYNEIYPATFEFKKKKG